MGCEGHLIYYSMTAREKIAHESIKKDRIKCIKRNKGLDK